jgi:hypothetical protein
MRVATDYLKGRIVEANLADLNKDEDQNYRKIRLQLLVSTMKKIVSSVGSRQSLKVLTASGRLWKALSMQFLWDGYDH